MIINKFFDTSKSEDFKCATTILISLIQTIDVNSLQCNSSDLEGAESGTNRLFLFLISVSVLRILLFKTSTSMTLKQNILLCSKST